MGYTGCFFRESARFAVCFSEAFFSLVLEECTTGRAKFGAGTCPLAPIIDTISSVCLAFVVGLFYNLSNLQKHGPISTFGLCECRHGRFELQAHGARRVGPHHVDVLNTWGLGRSHDEPDER